MAVSTTVSKTLGGATVADILTGSTTGYDLGTATQSSGSTPVNIVYFRHNGVNPITDASYYIANYSGSYGGDYNASTDYAKIIAHGDDGTGSFGLQIEETYSTAAFASPYTIKSGQAVNYATKRVLRTTSMFYNNSTVETAPTLAVQGQIGASGNTTLGDNAKLRLRYIIAASETLAGKRQFDIVFSYTFTT